jgi:GNAT superfamily N-acetyltransferase
LTSKQGTFRLRPSTPEDAEAIARVQVRSFQAGFVHIHSPEALRTLEPAPRVPLWREREAFVAEDGGGVVGVIQEGPSDEEHVAEIYRLFVAPEWWGTGVAQALLKGACARLKAAGFNEALLWVHADNPRARAFYEAQGWRQHGAEKAEERLGQPVTLLCYRTRFG